MRHWPPKPVTQVRFLPGTPGDTDVSFAAGAVVGGLLLYVLQRRTGSNVNYRVRTKGTEIVLEKGVILSLLTKFEVVRSMVVPANSTKLVPIKIVKNKPL